MQKKKYKALFPLALNLTFHLSSLRQRFCTESDAKNMLQCLKQNKNSELMDPKCKQMITKRQITQSTGEKMDKIQYPVMQILNLEELIKEKRQ